MSETPYKLRFLVLPDFIYSDSRLNATDIKVYSFINSYKGDKFYFTNEQLSQMFNIGDDSITRSISRLVKFGYIEAVYETKAAGGQVRFIKNLKDSASDTATLRSQTTQQCGGKDNKTKESNTSSKEDGESNFNKDLGVKTEDAVKGMKKLGDIFRSKYTLPQKVEKTDNRIGQGWQFYAHEVVEVAGLKNGGRKRIFGMFKQKNWGYGHAEKAKVVVKHKNYLSLDSEDAKVRYIIGALKNVG